MRKIILVLFVLCLSLTEIIHAQPTESRIIGYIPVWTNFSQAVRTIDYNGFSHILVSFANPDADGNINFGSTNPVDIQYLVAAAHQVGCQVLISIGGGNPAINEVWHTYMQSANRGVLNANLIELMNEYHFDGIDVDLEGDLVLSNNYAGYVADLDAVLPDHKILSAAMATWSASGLSAATLDRYDFINVMSYDQKGPWTPNSPGQHSSIQNAQTDINYWKNTKGLPADKVVLGVPFYGYNFVSSSEVYSVVYRDIVNQNEGAEDLDQVGNIYYNGQPTIVTKAEMAVDQAGGIMIWEITQDVDYSDDRSLLKSIHGVVKAKHGAILSTDLLEDEVSIYPIPSKDYLYFTALDYADTVSITNLDGKEVWQGRVENQRIDIRSLDKGMYVVAVVTRGEKMNFKIVKE